MSNIKYYIALTIFFLLAVVGLFFLSNLFHELSHQQDLKDISFNSSICLLAYPLQKRVAYYKFDYNVSDNQTYQTIRRYTEYKAWIWNILFAGIFLTSIYFIAKGKK